MTITELLNNVLAGGVLGLLGQGVRIAVGLKKLHDSNTAKVAQDGTPESFNPGRLLMSLFVGFVAGAIGMLVKNPTAATGGDLSTEAIVTIIAVGYSGADFIEGLFNTYIQKFDPPAAAAAVAVVSPGGAAVVTSGGQAAAVMTPTGGAAVAGVERKAVASDNVITPDRPLSIGHLPAAGVSVVNSGGGGGDTSNSAEHDR